MVIKSERDDVKKGYVIYICPCKQRNLPEFFYGAHTFIWKS